MHVLLTVGATVYVGGISDDGEDNTGLIVGVIVGVILILIIIIIICISIYCYHKKKKGKLFLSFKYIHSYLLYIHTYVLVCVAIYVSVFM